MLTSTTVCCVEGVISISCVVLKESSLSVVCVEGVSSICCVALKESFLSVVLC